MARAMGAAAACRARELFAPEVVMAAHEALFLELEQCRRQAPSDAHCARPVSPQLDPVRIFCWICIPSSIAFQATNASIQTLPDTCSKTAGSAMASFGTIVA